MCTVSRKCKIATRRRKYELFHGSEKHGNDKNTKIHSWPPGLNFAYCYEALYKVKGLATSRLNEKWPTRLRTAIANLAYSTPGAPCGRTHQ